MNRPLLLSLSILAAAALTACVADPEAGGNAPQLPSSETAVTGEGGRQPSPLARFFDEVYGLDLSAEERTQREMEIEIEIEDQIAQCMTAEGFEYTPDPSVPQYEEQGVDVDGISDADRNDREWVVRYGYGAVEAPERPMDHRAGFESGEKVVDAGPNQSYAEGLSAPQREAYEAALYGPPQTDDDIEVDRAPEDRGCDQQARIAVRGEDPQEAEEHEPLFEAIEDFYGTFPWPGIAELDASWAACMDANGQGGFERPEDASRSISVELTALWEAANPGAADDSPVVAGEQTPPPRDALTALATEERGLAIADLDCREQVDYWATYDSIQFAQEERFMADHQQAFDALRASYEQGSE